LNEEEFSEAVPGAIVSGTWTGHTGKGVKTVYVNVLLGPKASHQNRSPKYADTKFKKFTGCNLEVFETLNDLLYGESDTYSKSLESVEVILFY